MKAKRTIGRGKTNWKKLARMKDSEIDTSDIPELDDEWFKRATIRLPRNKVTISIRLDEDVLTWFKKQGPGYQTKINEVLKMYKDAKAA